MVVLKNPMAAPMLASSHAAHASNAGDVAQFDVMDSLLGFGLGTASDGDIGDMCTPPEPPADTSGSTGCSTLRQLDELQKTTYAALASTIPCDADSDVLPFGLVSDATSCLESSGPLSTPTGLSTGMSDLDCVRLHAAGLTKSSSIEPFSSKLLESCLTVKSELNAFHGATSLNASYKHAISKFTSVCRSIEFPDVIDGKGCCRTLCSSTTPHGALMLQREVHHLLNRFAADVAVNHRAANCASAGIIAVCGSYAHRDDTLRAMTHVQGCSRRNGFALSAAIWRTLRYRKSWNTASVHHLMFRFSCCTSGCSICVRFGAQGQGASAPPV